VRSGEMHDVPGDGRGAVGGRVRGMGGGQGT